jgi:uncharacterized protein YbjT (DUF2867 family)
MAKPILVAGATGGVGKAVVHKLLAGGIPVRVLARDFQAARAIFSDTVEYIAGEVREPDTLLPAVTGVEAVICTIGARYGQGDPTNTPEKVDYEGIRSLIDAAKNAEVNHFVLVSSMGVTRPDHPLNKMFDNVLDWKLKAEDVLRASGLSYTIVRPGGLLDEPGGKVGLRVNQGDSAEFTGRIGREDVAEVVIQALTNPALRNVTFEVIGGDGVPPADWNALFAPLKAD